MSTGGKHTNQNRLWLARQRTGLGQKQVAFLIGQHTVDQISRYEKGQRLPSLETALRLQIIYGTPLSELYAELHEQLRAETAQRIKGNHSLTPLRNALTASRAKDPDCGFAALLNRTDRTEADIEKVRDHLRHLARTLAYL